MKLPEYRLKQTIKFSSGNKYSNQDDPEFAAGTVVQPFWNETLLPSWRREELKTAKRMYKDPVMCIVGRHWVPVERENIRKD